MVSIAKNGTAYEWHGPSGAPTLVLIHGLGLRRETWQGMLPDLAQDFRVLNYDLFGHGESALPPYKPDLTLYAKQLYQLMGETGIDQAALVGFSLGGMINRRFAIDYPNKVSALAILNSPHERSQEAQKQVEKSAEDVTTGGPVAIVDAALERWFTHDFFVKNPTIVNEIRQWILANDPVAYAQCRQVLANGVLELIRPKPPIRVPSLIVTCENDSGSTPAMSRAMGTEIRGSETLVIPALKHLGLVEKPEVFTGLLIPFLSQIHKMSIP